MPRDRIEVDLRVGGRYQLTMLAGGREFTVGSEILELVEPELLVLRSDPMPEMGMPEPGVLRVEFHDHGPQTRMTLRDGPYPTRGRDGAEAGWAGAFAKLAALFTNEFPTDIAAARRAEHTHTSPDIDAFIGWAPWSG